MHGKSVDETSMLAHMISFHAIQSLQDIHRLPHKSTAPTMTMTSIASLNLEQE